MYRTEKIKGRKDTITYCWRVIWGYWDVSPLDQVRYVPVELTIVADGSTTGAVGEAVCLYEQSSAQ